MFVLASTHRDVLIKLADALAVNREREARLERAEHDLAQTQTDLRQAILLLGASTNRGTTNFLNEDIFKERAVTEHVYLTPEEDDFLGNADRLSELNADRTDRLNIGG